MKLRGMRAADAAICKTYDLPQGAGMKAITATLRCIHLYRRRTPPDRR